MRCKLSAVRTTNMLAGKVPQTIQLCLSTIYSSYYHVRLLWDCFFWRMRLRYLGFCRSEDLISSSKQKPHWCASDYSKVSYHILNDFSLYTRRKLPVGIYLFRVPKRLNGSLGSQVGGVRVYIIDYDILGMSQTWTSFSKSEFSESRLFFPPDSLAPPYQTKTTLPPSFATWWKIWLLFHLADLSIYIYVYLEPVNVLHFRAKKILFHLPKEGPNSTPIKK